MSLPKLLFVDDDESYLEAVGAAFSSEYHVTTAAHLNQAKQLVDENHFELIILDYHLSGSEGNGHSFIDYLKEKEIKTPVIVVSGAITLEMTLGFLKRQVSDFLEKPTSLNELRNSIKKVLASSGFIKSDGLRIDEVRRCALQNGNPVDLTRKEFEIFAYFLKHSKTQVSREEIQSKLWPRTKVTKNTFDTHLFNLRKKLPEFSDKLKCLYGVGYIYED